jgi:hypothetical protein
MLDDTPREIEVDEFGNHIIDEDGRPVYKKEDIKQSGRGRKVEYLLDEDGNRIIGEDGLFIRKSMFNKKERHIYQLDSNGMPVIGLDGRPILSKYVSYDENGKPYVKRRKNKLKKDNNDDNDDNNNENNDGDNDSRREGLTEDAGIAIDDNDNPIPYNNTSTSNSGSTNIVRPKSKGVGKGNWIRTKGVIRKKNEDGTITTKIGLISSNSSITAAEKKEKQDKRAKKFRDKLALHGTLGQNRNNLDFNEIDNGDDEDDDRRKNKRRKVEEINIEEEVDVQFEYSTDRIDNEIEELPNDNGFATDVVSSVFAEEDEKTRLNLRKSLNGMKMRSRISEMKNESNIIEVNNDDDKIENEDEDAYIVNNDKHKFINETWSNDYIMNRNKVVNVCMDSLKNSGMKVNNDAVKATSKGIQIHIKNLLSLAITASRKRSNEDEINAYSNIQTILTKKGKGLPINEARMNLGIAFGPSINELLIKEENINKQKVNEKLNFTLLNEENSDDKNEFSRKRKQNSNISDNHLYNSLCVLEKTGFASFNDLSILNSYKDQIDNKNNNISISNNNNYNNININSINKSWKKQLNPINCSENNKIINIDDIKYVLSKYNNNCNNGGEKSKTIGYTLRKSKYIL